MKPFSFWRFSETVLVVSLLGAPAGAATEKVLYSFCSQQGCADGQTPYASLINVKGTLYGTTLQGGANLFGTLFSITPDGKEKVVYSFGKARDAETPGAAKLINVKGTLYGTTYYGGAYNDGTVFSFDLTTGTEKVLHSFAGGSDGSFPEAGLIKVNGILYGTTVNGGGTGCGLGGGCGTVFSVDPATGKEKVYSFGDGARGAYPWASLINLKGTLYGTASAGGYHNDGSVFSITAGGSELKLLRSFGGKNYDGQMPYDRMISVNGTLYGTTWYGGSGGGGSGTVFSITTGGEEMVVYSFCSQQGCADGRWPYASLINVNGTLYGTTALGGANDDGTVFSLNPTTGTEHVLHSFGNGTDGIEPRVSLINVNGTLYGTTSLGGANGGGTVFSITP